MSEYVTDHDYFQECVVLQVADGLCVAKPVEGLIQVKAKSNNHSVINSQIKDKDSVSALNFDEYSGNGIFVGDMVNLKQPFQVDYSFRIDGIEVNKSSFTDNDGLLEESFYGLSTDEPVTLAQNIPWVAARLVLPGWCCQE